MSLSSVQVCCLKVEFIQVKPKIRHIAKVATHGQIKTVLLALVQYDLGTCHHANLLYTLNS